MIEFMKDGACDDGAETENGDRGRILVAGLGHAGINIVDQIVMRGWETCWGLDIAAFDADSVAVEGSVAPDKRLLGAALYRGLGCFGDPGRARALWKAEGSRILERVDAAQDVVLAVGLGGGTGATLAVEIAKAVRNRKAPGRVVAICTLPFAFEAETRQAHARYVLAELRRHADAVIVFANDRVDAWPEAAEGVRKGLHALNLSLARAVEAAAQILASGGMSPMTFGDLRSLFGRFGADDAAGENCWIGRAEGATAEPADALVDRALQSPLLAGAMGDEAWKEADSCLACVTGGPEFSIGQLKTVTRALEKAFEARGAKQVRLVIGARSVEHQEGRLGLSLLLASTRSPAPAPEPVRIETVAPAPVPVPVSAPVPVQAMPAAVPARKAAPEVAAAVAVAEPVTELAPRAAKPAPAEAARRGAKPVKQEELPFEAGSRGRFENSIETIHKGENLDQPTFRRRRLAVKV